MLFPIVLFSQYFQDVSGANGLNTYAPNFGHFGTGVSFADFDGDGWDDLTFGTTDGHQLFMLKNINGVLTPITPIVTHQQLSKQILWVDIDNDGDKDLFIATYGNGYNRLYENTGNMNMVDITASAGLLIDYASKSNSAAFGDFDKDGFLDLYITNVEHIANTGFDNRMFRNNGDLTFTNVTLSTGTGDGFAHSLACAFLDIEGDGDQDLYISNDRYFPNSMYKNNNDNTFTNFSSNSNTNIVIDAMNVGVGDYDNDNDLDIYITNNGAGIPSSALLQNNGQGVFTEVAASAGVEFLNRIGWAGNWLDMDNDLDLDLYVCSEISSPDQFNLIYENNGDGSFFTPLPNGLPGDHQNSYSNAYGDFNNDGKLDIVVANTPYPWIDDPSNHRLWKNTINNSNNYIKINLEGTISNRDGVGSWVELYAGEQKYLRYKHCGQGYLSQNTTYMHFGLGTNTTIDSIVVKWLSGHIDVIENPPINSSILISEGATSPLASDIISFSVNPDRNNKSNKINWVAENEETTALYLIQKSENGIHYETIKTIESNKQSSASNYNFTDEKVLPGILYYYRLKIFDEDSSAYFSKVVTSRIELEETVFVSEIHPNPTAQFLNFNIVSSKNQEGKYEFISQTGKVILSKKLLLNSGTNQLKLPTDRVGEGVTFLRIRINDQVITKRFIKLGD